MYVNFSSRILAIRVYFRHKHYYIHCFILSQYESKRGMELTIFLVKM